jgi:hypothetical protein
VFVIEMLQVIPLLSSVQFDTEVIRWLYFNLSKTKLVEVLLHTVCNN